MIDLYAHNQVAYDAAATMLSDTGKAAIIHPTGTGKSFIGFKLCEDNSDKTVCWLSPSDYIFRTQIENLKVASGGYEPQNIIYYTYAKLMLMSDEEIAAIKPNYIILDEFHRCGAEFWGQGVQNLLNTFPDTPILGLSATNIRYLDNQRDMADELFNGNIASEMTLGEAIVRGILNPPKYVLSAFSFQKDLEHYRRRVSRAKSKMVRDAGEKYLEAIRRAIDKADGLDVIFDKHMTDRTGKYIIFCANKEHMDEMQSHAKEWFRKIDKNPHVYALYTEDPSASKSFQAFKEDNDDKHLRLLYAIDALNEGVHVEDVSGVVLLRPTVSPIIYKQQIGRALSASKKKEPVIFDIVNNVENLYTIGALEEEMRAAITYYNYFEDHVEIVNERFTVFDEVKDCRILFEQLEDTLTASWDYMYCEAEKYYRKNKHLEVPRRYKTAEGYSLGSWIQTQRKTRAGEQYGNLDATRIEKLDAIGMRWETVADQSWNKYYVACEKYYDQNGHLKVPARYVTDAGINLGTWLSNIRVLRKNGCKSNFLTPERIRLLDEIGMIWDVPNYAWERNYGAALEYYKFHGDLNVPAGCEINGVKLGIWIKTVREAFAGDERRTPLTEDQIARLNSLGMRWEIRQTFPWEHGLKKAEEYVFEHGNLDVDLKYVTSDGFKLGKWLARQRTERNSGKLSDGRMALLEELGMVWRRSNAPLG